MSGNPVLSKPLPVEKSVKLPTSILKVREQNPLDSIFSPRNIAVFGATEKAGTVGRSVLWNLMSSPFGGAVFPVNPKRSSVLGIKSYPNIESVPEPADLAVIVTPAQTVPGIMDECVRAKVKGAVIISAGFKETGPEGTKLELEVLASARRGKIRVIGPNCLGVMRPCQGLNATFASTIAKPGKVGFISQSGALCTAILDWSLKMNVGFSAFISIGSMLDVGWGDLIDYLGDDPQTESIVLYMESIGDARSFLSAAREVSLTKPIIVIKAGRTQAAAKAAISHTGSLAGSDDALDAAFRRCGVLRVDSIAELFYMAEVFGKQPRPKGPRLAILTNAGGPGVLATDSLIASGGEVANLSNDTIQALNLILPPSWSHNNPVDILGDATPERYAKAMTVVSKDPQVDGILAVLTPQAMTDPTQTAEQLKLYVKDLGKPVLASWMGAKDVEEGEAILNKANIPTFPYPDTAARVFSYMWKYSFNLKSIYQTPELLTKEEMGPENIGKVQKIIAAALKSKRYTLTEPESKEVLSLYGIPAPDTRVAFTEAEAVKIAKEIGFPIAVKLFSEVITHKSDVGGVQLDVKDSVGVVRAFNQIKSSLKKHSPGEKFQGVTVQPMIRLNHGYELILGSSTDVQFGPVLLFGTGGQLVEVFKDRALALPPLNRTLARHLMERTKVYQALKGIRGRAPVNLALLEELIVRFSHLVVEQTQIREIDINPLFVSEEKIFALDARVVLHNPASKEDPLVKPAIRPYPARYVTRWKMNDGAPVLIRPIRPEDEPAMAKFHGTLSEESVHYRYFSSINLTQRTAHERLTRICHLDYDREMALVALIEDPDTGESRIIGVGRMSKLHGSDDAAFAVLITDSFQGRGLGTELAKLILKVARDEKVKKIIADILPDNIGMQKICGKLGFKIRRSEPPGLIEAEIEL